jgi:hypothetical protein
MFDLINRITPFQGLPFHKIILLESTKRFYSIALKISLTFVTLNPGLGPPPITYILSLPETADNP